MRKTLGTAVFALLGLASTGVAALNNAVLFGADALKDLSLDALATCGTACSGLTFRAEGDTAAETHLYYGAQSVAPMTRPLGKNICNSGYTRTAEGVVLELEPAYVVGSASRTCNGTVGSDGSANQGIEISAGDWRNALRIVYAGMPSGQDDLLLRDCNSAGRRNLVANWNDLFEGDCLGKDCNVDTHPHVDGGTPATRYDRFNNVVEPGLRHAFRLDESAGATDVFLGVLGLPQRPPRTDEYLLNPPEGFRYPAANAAQDRAFKALEDSPFCNVRRPTDTYPPVTVPSWTNRDGSVKSVADATAAILSGAAKAIPETVSLGTVPTPQFVGNPTHPPFTGWDHDNSPSTPVQWHVLPDPYFPEMQDQDPIRRKCVGTNTVSITTLPTEQVCSADAHLGLVLPISPPPDPAYETEAYPISACTGFAQKPRAVLKSNQTPVLCPDGSAAIGAPAECLVPIIQATGDCRCLTRGGAWGDNNGPNQTPIYTPLGAAPGSLVDGRVYNLHLRDRDCFLRERSRRNPQASSDTINVQMIGSFFRIHTSRSLRPDAPTSHLCKHSDTDAETGASRQIGCLVQASPCSIGFGSVQAVNDFVGYQTDDLARLAVNNVLPNFSTIHHLMDGGSPRYPINRKVYLNSLRGFHAPVNQSGSSDGEQELAKKLVAAADSIDDLHSGFVPLPNPVCEDFNELDVCPAAAGCQTVNGRTTCSTPNSPACMDVAVTGIPTTPNRCGDGVVQPGEECDDGNLVTDPAVPPADPTNDVCSVGCRVTP